MMKRLSGSFVGLALFASLCAASSTASAQPTPGPPGGDPLRDSYLGTCRPAARAQLKVGRRGSTDGTRVADRLCECAADRAESSGWVLPEFPARDAEACLSFARGFEAASPFARLALPRTTREARSARLKSR
jgi:hypothetical protein